MVVKNKIASVLNRLRNQAKEQKISFQVVLQLFVQEEFLRKLSKSRYSSNFVLKGGMFIYTLTKFDSRPTRDIDFLLQNLRLDMEETYNIMKEICSINTGYEYIEIDVLRVEQISTQKEYPGIRISFVGIISNVRVPFTIDIGIGDIITPSAIEREIITRLSEFESPKVLTYSVESTIAEKLDAILERMEATSRMKDFYDLYYLSKIFDFDGCNLQKALYHTFMRRKRKFDSMSFIEIHNFKNNRYLIEQWNLFEPAKAIALSFDDVLMRLERFLKPVFTSILENTNFNYRWDCSMSNWLRK